MSITSSNTGLLKTIESNEATLNDVHVALKIIKTLPVIGKYQKKNLPNTRPLEGYSQQLMKTINEAEKLSTN